MKPRRVADVEISWRRVDRIVWMKGSCVAGSSMTDRELTWDILRGGGGEGGLWCLTHVKTVK